MKEKKRKRKKKKRKKGGKEKRKDYAKISSDLEENKEKKWENKK